jgi:hypothetical protein
LGQNFLPELVEWRQYQLLQSLNHRARNGRFGRQALIGRSAGFRVDGPFNGGFREQVTGRLWPLSRLELAKPRIALAALPQLSGELLGTAAADH